MKEIELEVRGYDIDAKDLPPEMEERRKAVENCFTLCRLLSNGQIMLYLGLVLDESIEKYLILAKKKEAGTFTAEDSKELGKLVVTIDYFNYSLATLASNESSNITKREIN